jgi:glycosyltransferase involved in cell wall biosynthesis
MNVAIASTFHPYRGGIAAFNDRLASSLKEAGHDVRCYNWSRQYPAFLFPGEAQTISGHSTPTRSEAPLDSIDPRTWRATASKILSDGRVDVLILPFWHASLAPALRGVAKRLKRLSPDTEIVALMHNASSHDGSSVDKWLTKRFLKTVHSSVVLSDSVGEDVIKLMPGLECQVLFHPFYDHYPQALGKVEARKKIGIPGNVDLALFFGLIRPYKGLDVLLNTMSLVDENTHLLIAGECYENWKKYSDIIEVEGISDRVHVINKFVEEEELPAIFGASDFLVLPYKQASQSGVVATAAHYNTPIVASRVGDLVNSVNEGRTGLLVEPNNTGALAQAINTWTQSSNNVEAICKEYAYIREQRSWKTFVHRLFSI